MVSYQPDLELSSLRFKWDSATRSSTFLLSPTPASHTVLKHQSQYFYLKVLHYKAAPETKMCWSNCSWHSCVWSHHRLRCSYVNDCIPRHLKGGRAITPSMLSGLGTLESGTFHSLVCLLFATLYLAHVKQLLLQTVIVDTQLAEYTWSSMLILRCPYYMYTVGRCLPKSKY